MREIKFRGVNAYGDMIYGYLVPDIKGSTSYYDEYSQRICWYEENNHCNQPVKNGTVGQHTGLIDRNGVDIYEGDVVKYTKRPGYLKETTKWAVEFDSDECKWNIEYFWSDKVDVIGNIHQNPELVESNDE